MTWGIHRSIAHTFIFFRDQNKFKGITLIALFSNDPERWKQPFSFCFRESQWGVCDVESSHKDVWLGLRKRLEHKCSKPVQQRKETWGSFPFLKVTVFHCLQRALQFRGENWWEMTLEYWIYSYLSSKLLNLFKSLNFIGFSELILFSS